MAQPDNPYGTYLAYNDNNSWTSERGAAKFISAMIPQKSVGAGDSGAIINGFVVSQNSTPNMTVKILPTEQGDKQTDGHCIIGKNDYCYFGWLASSYTLAIGASSSTYPRISYVIAYVDTSISYDPEEDVIESPGVLKFVEVKGTAASTPVPPTTADIQTAVGAGNPYIVLASITVPIAATSIVADNIEDLREMASLDEAVFNRSGGDGELFAAGLFQANVAQTKTKIIITEANASTPAAIEGVQLVWLRKQA